MSVPTKMRNGLRVYGAWAGKPDGTLEDVSRCVEEVRVMIGRFGRWRQCVRKRGHGTDNLYCKQHDPEAVAKREAERYAKYEKEAAQRHQSWDDKAVGRFIRENDPNLYAETLKRAKR